MEVKRIDEKLYKAIMMAFQYQINCELTPGQCKELLDVIDNPLQVEDECVWTGEYYGYDYNGDRIFVSEKTGCSDNHVQTVIVPDNIYCPNCGKRIRYVEE